MDLQSKPTTKTNEEPKWMYLTGWLLLAFSSIIFVFIDRADNTDNNFTAFFIHYFLAIAYAVTLIWNRALGVRKSWKKEHIDKTILLLNLFLVSAYSLNRELPVFEDSTDWLCFYIVITSAAAISNHFDKVPQWIRMFRLVILGSALMFYIYLSFYVANFYFIGTIGMIFFGVGAHVFVPIFLSIACIALINHSCIERRAIYFVGLGFLATLSITVIFIIEWNSRILAIERIANQSVLDTEAELPAWVNIGQTIKNDWITQRILKSKLVYTVTNDHFQVNFLPTNTSWDEIRQHDPLVFLSSLVNKCSLPDEIRVKILESISDSRHRAQERLWSGDNLTTSYVVSDIDIYSELRLAYTEKYLNIKNNKFSNGWWGTTEEAIYTFQLPEGSVVTSLSLWIDGKEEKSILTSKQKANQAYTTIVGKESRDPSVVHWQEGNTISARIFPCTQKEERKFKIGFTSPLPEKNGMIVYKNITFRGPNPLSAKEIVRVRFIGKPDQVQLPSGFEKNKKGEYLREQNYDPDLAITFSATNIKRNQFGFGGYTYTIAPYKPEIQSVKFSKIFLDINNSWNKNELEELRFLTDESQVYVYSENELIKLDNSNWNEITYELIKRNFSLFPFHKVTQENSSLVISKGKELSPHLKDFRESIFAQKVKSFFEGNHKIKLYNLGNDVSTYVSSFRELRGLEFAEGDIDRLKNLIENNQFPKVDESEEKIILHDAQLMIRKSKTDSVSPINTAPDHLARIFAYNNIMRKVGASYFNDDFINDELVKEAVSAYVVSPVSSLIVLEKKADYDRFGIKDTDNSLHNASKQSSGAVPEPNEWALIILFVLLILFSEVRRYQINLLR